MYDAAGFDHYAARFADAKIKVSELVRAVPHSLAETVNYRPDLRTGYHSFQDKTFINVYRPPLIRPYSEREQPDLSPLEDYFECVFPVERDRLEVMRWAATLVVSPKTKMRYGLLLISETQGVGKTTLAEILKRPLGRDNVASISETNILNPRFTGYLENRLVVVNEIYGGHSVKAYDTTKEWVTDETLRIEKKFQHEYWIDNFCYFIACSNNIRALRLDNTDRRWLVPAVTTAKQSEDYWINFYRYLNDQGERKVMHWARKFAEAERLVSTSAEAPWTDAKRDLIEEQYSPGKKMISAVFHFIRDVYDKNGRVEIDDRQKTETRMKIIELAKQGKHFVMFDSDGVEAIKAIGAGMSTTKRRRRPFATWRKMRASASARSGASSSIRGGWTLRMHDSSRSTRSWRSSLLHSWCRMRFHQSIWRPWLAN
jgi:hypothetical protein